MLFPNRAAWHQSGLSAPPHMMMSTILTLCLLLPLSWAAPMHQQPPLAKAVCDKPNYLIFAETGWCFAPDTQVYLDIVLTVRILHHENYFFLFPSLIIFIL